MEPSENNAWAVKPVGGIEAVRLIPIGDLESVQIVRGCCTGITLRTGGQSIEWPILEDRSSYREETLCENGVPRIRHTLQLVCDPEELRSQTGARQLARLADEGVAARIETAGGTTLLAGWSERFGAEQPLRLQGQSLDTGDKPLARPQLQLTFTSEDTSPALPVEEA